MQLYDDQLIAGLEVVKNLKAGKTTLLCSPTGSGKTVTASWVVEHFNVPTLFLVNRQTLVSQSYETLSQFQLIPSVFHNTIKKTISGLVMNDDYMKSNTVISLVETLATDVFEFTPLLIVIDEAHKATSESYQELRKRYPNAMILGLSATPKREQNKEGEELVDWYEVMVTSTSLIELIRQGRLARPTYHCMNENDHVVETWIDMTALEENKRTIVFTYDARHSLAVLKSFEEAGVKAEIITSGSDLEGAELKFQTVNQRNDIFRRFRSGETSVLISMNALCEGFDEPAAKYCFLLRKVGAVALLHQMCGRVLRKFDDKPEGHIVDFCGNIEEHGPIEEYVWELDGSGHKESLVVQNGASIYYGYFTRKPKVFVICEECSHVYNVAAEENCPGCAAHNSVKVSATFSQLKDFFIEKIDTATWKKFCAGTHVKKGDEFWTFFDIIERAIKLKMTQKFNEMYCEIFHHKGHFHREYSWMETILDNKRKIGYKDRIEFVI